ncbi:hypothetical protein BpHYR1_008785 [Brachionus plicatilis]|uniref:RNA-directed DNA polymerase from mobile element jockey-like n=1 Tax=Brachionus plicatilis TaxID=10195 RepID=A0A3M7SCU3_BRAPC|nr:hypothetical protein BpHYR1_008785 [Brachionus plicatilis]
MNIKRMPVSIPDNISNRIRGYKNGKMSPEKCSYIFYSGNPLKNNKLSLKLFGKQIPYTDSPVFLGIKFGQSLCFNSQVEFIRSRCHDRIVEVNKKNLNWSYKCTYRFH